MKINREVGRIDKGEIEEIDRRVIRVYLSKDRR